MTGPDTCSASTVHVSENVQIKICILQIRLAQFTDHMKKAKKVIYNWN